MKGKRWLGANHAGLLVLGLSALMVFAMVAVALAGAVVDETDLTSYGKTYEVNLGDDGWLYVSDYNAQEIWRINPADNSYAQYKGLGKAADAQPDGDGQIWWTDGATSFSTLTIGTNEKTTWSLVGDESFYGIALDDVGFVWLSEWFGSSSKIHRFSPIDNELCHYALGGSYSYYLQYDNGFLWLINWFGKSIIRFDPGTLDVQKWSINDPKGSPNGFDIDENGLFWWTDNSPSLSSLDPANNERTRYDIPTGAGSNSKMVDVSSGRIWYTESVSNTVGLLDPAAAAGITSTLTAATSKAVESCEDMGSGATSSITTETGTLEWTAGTLTTLADSGGWTIYELAANANPHGIASGGGYHWVTDNGRQNLLRFSVPREGVLSLQVEANPTSLLHGQSVTYSYFVTYSSNDGSAAQSIVVSDDTCTGISFSGGDDNSNNELDVDETWQYSCAYTIPAHADDESNPVVNNGEVAGNDADGSPISPATDSASVTITHDAGTLEVAKSGPTEATHGQKITFSYEVSYDSQDNAPAKNVVVVDDLCSPVIFIGGDGDGDSLLNVSETWTYGCQYQVPPHQDDEADPLVNTATATGQDFDGDALSPGTDQHSTDITHAEGELTVVKSGPDTASHGDTVEFDYTVTYDSSDKLPTENVVLVDDKCSPVDFTSGDSNGNGYLDIDESWSYFCSYTVPPHAIGEEDPIINTATATGQDADGDAVTTGSDQHTTDILHEEGLLSIDKSGPETAIHGETIIFTYDIEYVGPDGSSAKNVVVVDDKCSPVTFIDGDTNADDVLDIGEIWHYNCEYEVPDHSDDEEDPIINTATLTGKEQNGDDLDPAEDKHTTDILHEESGGRIYLPVVMGS